MKKTLLVIFVLFVFAANARPATILQNWNVNDWLQRVESSSQGVFNIYPGYINTQLKRKNGANTVAQLYKYLGSDAIAAGTSAGAVHEFWMGLDFQYLSGTTSYQSLFGIFYSQSDNLSSSTNRNWIALTLGGASVIAQAQQNASDGTAYTVQLSPITGSVATDTYRVKMHVYNQGGNTVADVQLYQWITDSQQWSPVGNISGVLLSGTNKFSVGLDALGVRNAYNSTSYTSTAPSYNMDNFYFSTLAPMPDIVFPMWVSAPGVPAQIDIYGNAPEIKPGLAGVNAPIQHQTYFRQERELYGYNPHYTPNPVGFGPDDQQYFKGDSWVDIADYNGVKFRSYFSDAILSDYPQWDGTFEQCGENRIYLDNYNYIYAIANPTSVGYCLMLSKDVGRSWRAFLIPGSPLDVRMECRDGNNDSGPPSLLIRYMQNSVNTLGLVVVTKDGSGNPVFSAPVQVASVPVAGGGFKNQSNILVTRNNKTHIVFPCATANANPGTPIYGITYDRATGTTNMVLLGNTDIGYPNENNWPCISVDKNGYLHVILTPYTGGSGKYCTYLKSSQPNTVASGWSTPETLTGLVRASMVCDTSGTVHVVAADISDLSRSLKYTYKQSGQSWSSPAALVTPWNDNSGQASPETFYDSVLSIDKRNRLFVNYSIERTLTTPAQQAVYEIYNPCGTKVNNSAILAKNGATWQLATSDKFVYQPVVPDTVLTDSQFFNSLLNLNYNGLSAVKTAVQQGNYPNARKEFAKYLRQRTEKIWYWDPHIKVPSQGSSSDLSYAYDFANHTGIYNNNYWLANGDYDWLSTPELSSNWYRMYFLETLGRAYWYSQTEYPAVTDYVNVMRSWIGQVAQAADVDDHYWSTIATGIRMRTGWLNAFAYCQNSPLFDDNTMNIAVKSAWEQSKHLRDNHATSGNWLTFAMAGLYSTGVFFPELADATAWRNYACQTAIDDMTQSYLPDGMGVELTCAYAQAFYNYFTICDLAEAVDRTNELNVDLIVPLCETPLDSFVKIMAPDGHDPSYNDNYEFDVKSFMNSYYAYYPSRPDFKWIATNGSQGSAPSYTSAFLPYAGYAAMRSGWGTADNYLGFDVGPIGKGHAHQDKLNVVLWAYGRKILFDSERVDYTDNIWSEYAMDAFSHNTVMVDNRPQRRSWGTPQPSQMPYQPISDCRWESDSTHDFASGIYENAYGMQGQGTSDAYPYWDDSTFKSGWVYPARHYRRVYFLKPDIFIVCDTMVARDSSSHTYDVRWHLNTTSTTVRNTNWVDTTNSGQANLEIVPLITSGLSIYRTVGQTSPEIMGWKIGASNTTATTLQHKKTGNGTVQFLTLLVPLHAGTSSLVQSVTTISSTSWDVNLSDGRVVHISYDTSPTGNIYASF
ncbi:MAG: alginate lyase family protein [Phycisphaerae bacterium]|jgi:hypothetical protein